MLTNQRALLVHVTSLLMVFGMVCPTTDTENYFHIQNPEVETRSNFVIDSENSKVIVATTNEVFHLNLDLTGQANVMEVPPEADAHDRCRDDGNSRSTCQNYHRVVILPPGTMSLAGENGTSVPVNQTVLTCSTNARSPKCVYRMKTTLEPIVSHSGISFLPRGTERSWIPTLMTSSGQLASATRTSTFDEKFDLVLSGAPYNGTIFVKSKEFVIRWFNSPKFVSLYEIGDYIYLFLREPSLEADAFDIDKIYSRVARVCKNDLGLTNNGENIFTSFIKARIVCTSSDQNTKFPFKYNDLYDAHYVPEEGVVYATFRSPQNGPLGSVVCMFNLERDISSVYNGRYLVQDGSERFTERDNFHPFTCKNSTQRSLTDILDIQLMARAATSHPLVALQGYAFQRILVDVVNGQKVFFITATKKNENALLLLKVLPGSNADNYHIIETRVLSQSPTSEVTKMEKFGSGMDAYIYIGTESELFRIPVQTCSMFSTCCECVASRDPYCGFVPGQSCQHVLSGSSRYVQDLQNGNTTLCLTAVDDDDNNNNDNNNVATGGVATPTKTCGGVAPTGGVTVDNGPTTSTSATGPDTKPSGTVEAVGLGAGNSASLSGLGDYTFIIVGTVAGFVGGVTVGVVMIMVMCCLRKRGRNKTLDLTRSCEIVNVTNTVMPMSHRKDMPNGNTGGKDDLLRINNSTSEFVGSNNFTRSGNDYMRHLPAHLQKQSRSNSLDHARPQVPPAHIKQASFDHAHYKQPLSPTKYLPMPPSPVKPVQPHPESPVKPPPQLESDNEGASAVTSPKHTPIMKSFSSTNVPPIPPPSADLTPPLSSGYKSGGGSVFTFSAHSTPRASTYSNGASAYSSSDSSSYQASPVPPSHTDPNVKLNYNAKVYLTNSQKAAYGRNILARQPSVDGSKMKYIDPGSRRASSSSYASESLPRSMYHRRADVVQLPDSEMGCSQC